MPGGFPRLNPIRQLPEQPDLEQLHKEAHELFEGHRAGDVEFALHDAQRVLAREYGFDSWPKLKAFVDGVNVALLARAVQEGDLAEAHRLLEARPELAHMDMHGGDERRALHFAVMRRDAAMARLLMEAGADARKGVWPHRDATSAWTIARDRGFDDVAAVIEDEERARIAQQASCPNATISPAQEQIRAAIARDETAEAIALLEKDPKLIRACGLDGGTPLHAAAGECNEELVAWLLARRGNADQRDLRGLTPLDRAALAAGPDNEADERCAAVARLLLKHGAAMTIRGAVALGDAAFVREWARAGRAIGHYTTSRGGLVSVAVNHGQMEMVRLLLDLGADPDERIVLEEVEKPTPSWGMPLWNAARANRREIAELLLERGADPNSNVYASGWPLLQAWNHEDGAIRRLLIERGAKRQPYMVSQARDVEEAARLLDADPDEETVSELAWSAADAGFAPILELALRKLPWEPTSRRWHWILLQPIRGASSDSAQNAGFFACMEAILRHGVDPNPTHLGQTVLHFTAARRSLNGADRARFAAMLIDAGARLDVRDDILLSTPLGWACRWGRLELVELLIARGAPVQETDAQPWATPMAWAEKMGHDGVARLLRSRNL